MPELQRLAPEHAEALLVFEQQNRAYFAATVPDRGDDYFGRFDERLGELLTEQAAGQHHFHVFVGDRDTTDRGVWRGVVLGRINLVDVDATDGSAELGFRIAEHAAGRGLATEGVRQVCVLAGTEYGLRTLHARATLDNVGSRRVLERSGFTPAGEITLDDKPGLRYVRDLSAAGGDRADGSSATEMAKPVRRRDV